MKHFPSDIPYGLVDDAQSALRARLTVHINAEVTVGQKAERNKPDVHSGKRERINK
jgi:hypothetical protein